MAMAARGAPPDPASMAKAFNSIKIGKILTWILIVFMCCNMIVSIMALVRSDQRAHGVKATYSWQQTMDERFDDARLQRIYPNALKVE